MVVGQCIVVYFFFQAEDGIRDLVRSRGLGDVYKRQDMTWVEENLGWKAKISIEEGMRRVYDAALKKI